MSVALLKVVEVVSVPHAASVDERLAALALLVVKESPKVGVAGPGITRQAADIFATHSAGRQIFEVVIISTAPAIRERLAVTSLRIEVEPFLWVIHASSLILG